MIQRKEHPTENKLLHTPSSETVILGANKLQQEAHQLVGLGKTLCRSTSQFLQTLSQIQCVITGDLASNCDGIVRLYVGHTQLTHFLCSI